MNLIESLFGGDGWHNLILALIHSLWQGLLVALVAGLLMRRLNGRRPETRYAIALGGLAATVLLLLGTWAVLAGWAQWSAALHGRVAPAAAVSSHSPQSMPASAFPAISSSPALEPRTHSPRVHIGWTPYATAIWLAGAVIMLLRLAGSLVAARQLTRLPALPEEHPLSRIACEIAERVDLRRIIRVASTDHVAIPAVAGLLRPVVLLPATMLTGLTSEQLRVVLAHELAHIRRHDVLVSLVQQVVEALLFFNPAVAWLGRQVRLEREACCDALAVKATGDPIAVAQALAGVASAVHERAFAPALALADGGKGTLLQRVQRLLQPERQFPARLPLPTFLILMVLCVGALAALGLSAAATGRAAAKWLTPQEQIQQVREARDTYGPALVDPQDQSTFITLQGRVRTEDGSPLPPKAYLHVMSEYRGGPLNNQSTGSGLPLRSDGRFTGKVNYGQLSLTATADGYAPTELSDLKAEPGGTISGIDITLSRGLTAQVRLVDDQGRPVPGAAIHAWQVMSSIWLNEQQLESDQEGLITVEHLAPKASEMEANIPGYQSDRQSVILKPGEPFVWTLLRAKPVRGVVVDKVSGKPIEGATIYLAGRQGFETQFRDIRQEWSKPDRLATTNAAGEFVLDTLRNDSTYSLWIEAAGRGVQLARDISTRQGDVRIEFAPVILSGRVVGDLDRLRKDNSKPFIEVENTVQFGNTGYGGTFRVPVEIENGVGKFGTANIVPGGVTLVAGGEQKRLTVQENMTDAVIDLPGATTKHETRKVIVRLVPPEGWPVSAGTIRVDCVPPGHRGYEQVSMVTVVGGQAIAEVELPEDKPGTMRVEPGDLPGYSFQERVNIQVPHGREPMVLDIPVEPAGAVYGKVLRPDGSPAERFSTSLITVRRPENAQGLPPQPVSGSGDGRFNINGVPLDGIYRVLVSDNGVSGEARVISEEFTINRSTPTHEVTLQFVDGVRLDAIVLGPDGQPRSGVAISLDWNTQWSYSADGITRYSDNAGRLQWQQVNPDLPAKYYLDVKPGHDTCGLIVPVDLHDVPVRVQLQAGLSASGIVIDDATGRPIPGAELRLSPTYGNKAAKYREQITTTTDQRGRFSFGNLEPGEYSVSSMDVGMPGSELKIVAGQQDQQLHVKIWPNSTVRPLAQHETRKVTVHLVPPEGWPMPEGKIRIDCVPPGRDEYAGYNFYKLVEGKVTADVALPQDKPGKMLIEPADLPGYLFKARYDVGVPHGEEPMVLDIPVEPVGAVYGKVLRQDGSPAERPFVDLITVKGPENMQGSTLQPASDSGDGRFIINGVRLGAGYRIVAHDISGKNDACVLSEEFAIDRSKPTHEASLRFVDGVALDVFILGPDGKPRPGVVVSLYVAWSQSAQWKCAGPSVSSSTDAAGRVQWQHVNPSLPAQYILGVHPGDDTQGLEVPVDFRNLPIRIQLQAGLSASGVVMDDATGSPVPGATLTLFPSPLENKTAKYRGPITTTTDQRGRFQLGGLEAGVYAVFTARDAGGAPIRPADSKPRHDLYSLKIVAGQQDQELRVKVGR